MKIWLSVALLSSGAAVAASLWLAPPAAVAPTAATAPSGGQSVAPAALKPAPLAPLARPYSPALAAAPPAEEVSEEAAFSVAEAQMLMQLMAESGDPRQPAAGGLQPRTPATAAQLANPEQYAAFEGQQSRAEVQAWTLGVQQIPQIREHIEQAAQSGERSNSEIDEARAALEQLEMLHSKLQREAPQLLPTARSAEPVPQP